ncbi:hypothetical protein HCJ66_12035 [Listeria sp. FSL L7-1582]|uniref:bifunctional hydroxymethylpyrimidine kinase/phosphomethylpyrimidine kinase n=1 Tax=Listeria portnoyi TaxID=2713504 RepID=UPI00164E85FD|nr:bifunctional hydroxymethylpyrimidine kinase/phosphomethylpyrimidine kinase [Listeria portnoyi]MBC6310268.1 hypothetical protein [Listeria portnoyi]
MVRFSEELHAENREIWQRSKDHPFVQQLVDGSLDKEAFRYYLLQDHYYLTHYVKVIALGIAYADDYSAMMGLSQSLASLEVSELAMREKFYSHVGIEAVDLDGDTTFGVGAKRVETMQTHGIGYTFSACITAEIAIRTAKAFITSAISQSMGIGHVQPDETLGAQKLELKTR